MSNPFIGEIRMFAGNFAPNGWAICDGSLVAISENETLFNLIGTTYGGDGQSTFALPDLRGRIPVHQGQGPGLQNYVIGQQAGTETVTLTVNQMPSHGHPYVGTLNPAAATSPNNSVFARAAGDVYTSDLSSMSPMAPQSVSQIGGSQPHDNVMPYLVINFIISLFGIFPSPS
ncbi:MAG: tail fiber protein [Anaerolineae bacterium]